MREELTAWPSFECDLPVDGRQWHTGANDALSLRKNFPRINNKQKLSRPHLSSLSCKRISPQMPQKKRRTPIRLLISHLYLASGKKLNRRLTSDRLTSDVSSTMRRKKTNG